ncbi:MAG: nucleotidyltransferase [Melioribacteraceae bacterium]|nr:nucleotidyltransferase [Melioribacteraceae bacterium]MCF8355038.1 nucleotidyltransferase [Melioribacteraceae bacterium]MCF8392717.1 nucleotidyltransferase [Melioribacteraceae bacterium]MCF8417739.1 nucleotidyltransferase [Melioribacteraceae bacterium]
MAVINLNEQFNNYLQELSNTLDITKEQYDSAVNSYEAVGNWLADENSLLHPYKPEILPQGSFLLGTMIKATEEDDDLDIDLVCRLIGKKEDWTQYDLKTIVGNRIKDNETYKERLQKEGRRCWTIKYSHSRKFHLDILPSIVSQDYEIVLEKSFIKFAEQDPEELAIRITDRELENYKSEPEPNNWPKSNPFGYADWFQKQASLDIKKGILFEERVQPVPQYKEDKLPLQRAIQILKRHRDLMFKGDEDKPISIIITTLAAQAYGKETDVLSALSNIIEKMDVLIEEKYDPELKKVIKWIGNPVNPEENFADKWSLNNTKQKNFYKWILVLKDELKTALRKGDIQSIIQYLKSRFGTQVTNEAAIKLGISLNKENSIQVKERSDFDVPHRQKPVWPIQQNYEVKITAKYIKDGGYYWSELNGDVLPKRCSINFHAKTNAPDFDSVHWQVVNTGSEAERVGKLRGSIFPAKTAGVGGLKHTESTLYVGTHWIECFIVKNGVCIAKSGEYIVRIN